jgi:hypothetical protein
MAKSKPDYTPKNCTFSIRQQIREIERELTTRKSVYDRLIRDGKLSRQKANKQYGALNNAKRSLELLLEIMVPAQEKIQL